MDMVANKSGWRTSEFWASLVFGAGGVGLIVWAACTGLRPGVDIAIILAGALLSAASFGAYAWSRARVKSAHHDATAAVASSRSRSV